MCLDVRRNVDLKTSKMPDYFDQEVYKHAQFIVQLGIICVYDFCCVWNVDFALGSVRGIRLSAVLPHNMCCVYMHSLVQ